MKKESKLKIKLSPAEKDGSIDSEESVLSYRLQKKTNFIFNNTISFIIYLFTFFIFYYIKRESLLLEANYVRLFSFLIISLITGTILSNKFNLTRQHEIGQTIRKLYVSLVISLGSITILLLIYNVENISRYQLMGTMLSGFVIEVYYYFMISERRKQINLIDRAKVSFNYLLTDAIILSLFCYILIIRNIKPENIDEKHLIMLAAIYISWLFSAATTHKFNPIEIAKNKWNAFGLQIKFYLLIISLVGLSVYLLQLNPGNWEHFIQAIIAYSAVSFLLFIILFAEKVKNKSDEVTAIFLKAYELKGPAIPSFVKKSFSKYSFKNIEATESVLKQKLQFEYLKDYKDVFLFLDRMLELKSFDTRKTFIIRSSDPYNIAVLIPESYQLLINLHELNDQRKINDYLRNINKRLIKGGVFVGSLVPNKNRNDRYLKKYQFLIANLLSFIDFIWKRVFPKLPFFRKIYFTFSRGKDAAISLAEGLGRLVYCGFEILDLTEINETVYFAAVKAKESSSEENPQYSPIFKMRRIGENGKKIYVYKLRTMHPYSEFIQDFVYEQNDLESGGKFKNDFRIPAWGKLFREIWLDEIPMLVNWLKGDLKFVGIRPLSSHYLNLYSKHHKERRKKFKPGLVPPFYADMPVTIKEIEESESKYLDAYEKHPVKTDIIYFFKVLYNILIRRKRSQ